MTFERGSLVVGKWRGAPIRLHWSVPVGMLLFTRLQLAPAAWLAFLVLVLVHELGHAWMVRRFKLAVQAIEVTGFGGHCHWRGDATLLQESWIAAAGVLAQLVVLLPIGLLLGRLGPPSPWVTDVAEVLTWTNLWLVALNLLPIAPLDGVTAWNLPGRLRQSWRRKAQVRERQERVLREAGASEPPEVDGEPDPELMAEVQAILADAARKTKPPTDA